MGRAADLLTRFVLAYGLLRMGCVKMGCAVLAGIVLGAAHPVRAQEHNRFAMGITYNLRMSANDDAHGRNGVGVRWRLGHDNAGWGWHVGLGWYSTDIDHTINGNRVTFGKLTVKPLVGGYGYTHRLSERVSIKGALTGGVAFTRLERTLEADRELGIIAAGAGDSRLSKVVPIIRPEASLWYDVHPKVGIGVGAAYTIARPKLAITTSSRTLESGRLNADTFTLSTGVVYRIF